MTDNEITYKIRGAIYKVYNAFGPGLLESVYEAALCHQLRKEGLTVENQVKLNVMYDNVVLPVDFRLDILVEKSVIIELKSVGDCTYFSVSIPCSSARRTLKRLPSRR